MTDQMDIESVMIWIQTSKLWILGLSYLDLWHDSTYWLRKHDETTFVTEPPWAIEEAVLESTDETHPR